MAEKLVGITPGNTCDKGVFFCNSGAEACEAAIKLARHTADRPSVERLLKGKVDESIIERMKGKTSRSWIIAFYGAFHGRTYGAMSLSASKPIQRKRFAPFMPGVIHAPYAYCYRCPLNLSYPACDIVCVDYIEQQIFSHEVPPDEVAAIFVEPIQGESGYVIPPDGYHQKLKALAEKYDILFVADEIQSGLGRTGKMFAIEHWKGVVPDIICIGKAIASGLPLGAIVARKSLIMEWEPGTHANTFGGNPVACSAALEVIRLLEEHLVGNAAQVGEFMLSRLLEFKDKHPLIGDVRGKGLMIGVELVRDRETKENAGRERNEVVKRAMENGLLLIGCGTSTIRFCPPLIITEQEAQVGLDIFDQVLAEVEKDLQI